MARVYADGSLEAGWLRERFTRRQSERLMVLAPGARYTQGIVVMPTVELPTRLEALRDRYACGEIELAQFEAEVDQLLAAGLEDKPVGLTEIAPPSGPAYEPLPLDRGSG